MGFDRSTTRRAYCRDQVTRWFAGDFEHLVPPAQPTRSTVVVLWSAHCLLAKTVAEVEHQEARERSLDRIEAGGALSEWADYALPAIAALRGQPP